MWTFPAGWSSRETLNATLVEPGLVVEISADTARDSAGHFRHPVRALRVRDDLTPGDTRREQRQVRASAAVSYVKGARPLERMPSEHHVAS